MKTYLLALLLFSIPSLVGADIPKVHHVVKVKITTTDESLVTYALVRGELNYSESLLRVYKKDPGLFTTQIKQLMSRYDSMSLYSGILRVKEHGLILLPKDRESKIAIKEIQKITLTTYLPSEYTAEQIFTDVLTSDSTWVSWKVSQTTWFETVGNSGICGFQMLYFNKPDNNSQVVAKHFESIIRRREEKNAEISDLETRQIKERLRKARIIVIYNCGC